MLLLPVSVCYECVSIGHYICLPRKVRVVNVYGLRDSETDREVNWNLFAGLDSQNSHMSFAIQPGNSQKCLPSKFREGWGFFSRRGI